ncbi:MAG: [formate-C-acetyltransferase]-activating enzyme [Clostridiaceae bacterium]
MKGLIFNIQRYSIHDGNGIRTLVFFKGCPLRCPWCSNPESQSFDIEKVKIKKKCIHCDICSNNEIECPSGAIKNFGKWMTVDEVIAEVSKDFIFYNTSNGGVTLSGGEVLSQTPFALELLKRLKSLNVNTAIETCGMGSLENIKDLAEYTDLFLFDLKIMDKSKAKELLKANVDVINNNIKALVKMGKNVIPRIPLIPGYTMDSDNISSISNFVLSLGLKEIHILPFHQYGSNKYEFLNRDYKLKNISPPNSSDIDAIKNILENNSLKVSVGGL